MKKLTLPPNCNFFFLGPDSSWGITLSSILPNYHFLYHCPDPLAKKTMGDNFFSPSSPLKSPNSAQLLSLKETQNYIREKSKGKKTVIIPFKNSARLSRITKENNWVLAAPDYKLSRRLENKIIFAKLIQALKIHPSHLIAPFNSSSFKKAAELFGLPLVIQTSHGWAGHSSHLTKSFSNLSPKIAKGLSVKYMPFLKGNSFTINAYVGRLGQAFSPPAAQLTGLPPWTQNPLATCGRQWPAVLSSKAKKTIHQQAQKTAQLLKKLGYRGFFGLDFLQTKDGKIYLIECNPRLTASFALYSLLESETNLSSLLFYHLADHLSLATPLAKNRFSISLSASEIVFRNSRSQPYPIPALSTKLRQVLNNWPPHSSPILLSPPPGQKITPGAEVFRLVRKEPFSPQSHLEPKINIFLKNFS